MYRLLEGQGRIPSGGCRITSLIGGAQNPCGRSSVTLLTVSSVDFVCSASTDPHAHLSFCRARSLRVRSVLLCVPCKGKDWRAVLAAPLAAEALCVAGRTTSASAASGAWVCASSSARHRRSKTVTPRAAGRERSSRSALSVRRVAPPATPRRCPSCAWSASGPRSCATALRARQQAQYEVLRSFAAS